jgi:biotin operon repressor
MMREEKLIAYLKGACPGRRYTVRSAELEQVLGISSTELRKLINCLRRKGFPIGSSKDGYFYAVTAGEVYATIRQLRKIINGMEAAISGLEFALDSFALGSDEL